MGAKRVFELFPGGLKARSRAERKKGFSKLQRQALTAAAAHAATASREPPVSLHPSRSDLVQTHGAELSDWEVHIHAPLTESSRGFHICL